METAEPPTSATPSGFDKIAADLQDLRRQAGSPSYGELALRIAQQRTARGVPAAEARVGRTTVYDAFRPGRRRLDSALVLEIVRALGADEADLQAWANACAEAHRQHQGSPSPRTPATTTDVAPIEGSSAPAPPAPVPAPTPFRPTLRWALVLSVACLGVNMAGRLLNEALHLPIYLDMVGTAVAAITVGPWWGAAIGLVTNLVGVTASGPASLPFALVNVAGALAWGYGVRRCRMGSTLPRFFVLNLLVALLCSCVAVPILLIQGNNSLGTQGITEVLVDSGFWFAAAVFVANLVTSVADKVISGFVAITAAAALPEQLRAPLGSTATPLPQVPHPGTQDPSPAGDGPAEDPGTE